MTGEDYRVCLRYHGGKGKIAAWIAQSLPPHDVYVEPFGGAASVLLAKPPAPLEVYNDLWGEVVNFFRVLRDDSDALLSKLNLTPWSRAEYQQSYELSGDPVEDARRLFVRSMQGYGGLRVQGGHGRRGWRFFRAVSDQSTPKMRALIENLAAVAVRFQKVQIEQDTAANVIRRYDTPATLFYVDPPYITEMRQPRYEQAYFAEMSEWDHRVLAQILNRIEGAAIVSGLRSALYGECYENLGWVRMDKTTRGERVLTESIWLSPRALEQGR